MKVSLVLVYNHAKHIKKRG